MAYILATTESKVRWYKFDFNSTIQHGKFELMEILDLGVVPQFGDKGTAKATAMALGLKTWRYVKI